MRTAIRTLGSSAIVALALALSVPASAQADDPEGYGDGYQAGNYGRLRSADNGAAIVRANGDRDDGDRASVNAPIFPGDAVRTDGGQRVEIQLAGGSLVRIDRGSEVVFQSLPDPYAKYQDNTVLALSRGVVRIASRLADKQEFRVDTRDASVYLLGEGEFRIEVDERGGTRVASLRGVTEVVGSDASVLVRGGTRTSVLAGSAPDDPRAYSAFTSDGFDRWCASRDDTYRARDRDAAADDSYEEVPAEVQPYYGELSAHGTWATVPEYGTVWYPSGVASGWRPYDDGYWSYGPSGYFWVSYEPWGWAPYHYGNWQYVGGHGWGWIPGHVFAGAWVSWSWGSLYVGWAPLDFWGGPAWVGGPYYHGYYDPGCWTFVDYNHIGVTNVNRYAVPVGRIGDDLRHATVVARPPRVDPKHLAESKAGRERALRQVADDRASHMRPISADRKPERRLADMQDRMIRRSPRAGNPSGGRTSEGADAPRPLPGTPKSRTIVPRSPANTTITPGSAGSRDPQAARPRRILEEPRATGRSVARPSSGSEPRSDSRDGVRDLYERMSRPRETRGQDAAPRAGEAPLVRPQTPRPQAAPQRPPSRADAPRAQAPRAQAPRAQAPRAQAPRAQAPRAQAPQRAAPAPRAQAQPKPQGHDKH